jgi:SAM-dependent methyltransferase
MPARLRDFAKDYELGRSPVLRELERSVLGCDYGGTSWTTRREASWIVDKLDLRPHSRLLEIGAGSGWPGLFIAQLSGCDVVLVDLPYVGLKLALERAALDGLGSRCRAVLADGAALPFNGASFDAVSHSDVLCCTPAKLPMLQACRHAARAGAKMVFSVIALRPSLTQAERNTAIEFAPPFADSPEDYASLLIQSEWDVLERSDVTEEYQQSLRTSLDGWKSRARTLIEVLGQAEFSERVKRRQGALAALQDRLVMRELFVAVAG